MTCAFLLLENIQEFSELNTFQALEHYGFKDTVVNRALSSLQERPLEITLTVPLIKCRGKRETANVVFPFPH